MAAATQHKHRHLPTWTLLTSHGLVLLFVASHNQATIREIAEALQLTERRVADIIRDLAAAELISVRREGRRNHYQLNKDARFRHPVIADVRFRDFLTLWQRSQQRAETRARRQQEADGTVSSPQDA